MDVVTRTQDLLAGGHALRLTAGGGDREVGAGRREQHDSGKPEQEPRNPPEVRPTRIGRRFALHQDLHAGRMPCVGHR
jgi:hypothetical protein